MRSPDPPDLLDAFPLRLLVLTRLIVRFLRCGLVRSGAGSGWEFGARVGFSPFFSFPGPLGLIRCELQLYKRDVLGLQINK